MSAIPERRESGVLLACANRLRARRPVCGLACAARYKRLQAEAIVMHLFKGLKPPILEFLEEDLTGTLQAENVRLAAR